MENRELQIQKEVKEFQPFPVIDEETRDMATHAVIQLKSVRKKIIEYWSGPKEKAKQAKQKAIESLKEVCKKEDEMLGIVDRIAEQFDDEIKAYLNLQEKKRIEEQRKRDEEARKQAEEEKEKIDNEIEELLEQGKIEQAVEKDQEKETIKPVSEPVAPVIPKKIHTDHGMAYQKRETIVTLKDPAKFFKFCAKNNLIHFWEYKPGRVKSWVKEHGHKGDDIPGLLIEEEISQQYRNVG